MPPPKASETLSPPTASSPLEGPNRRQKSEEDSDRLLENVLEGPEVLREADRRQAENALQQRYGKRITAAKSNLQKLVLARELWNRASRSAENAVERDALRRLSLHLAVETGRLHQALADVENLEECSPGDAADLKVETVIQAVQALRSGAKQINPFEVLAVSPAVIEQARQVGRFEEAGRLIQLVTPLAKLAKDPNLLHDLASQSREVGRLKALSASVRRALEKLREDPDDQEANGLVGRWITFRLQDWKRGLPLLAKSSDAVLAPLAAADLADPRQPALQAELAEGYWNAAQKEQEAFQAGILARAEFWFHQARPGLSEAAQIQAVKRLEALDALRQSERDKRGAVQPGNVALATNGTQVEGVQSNGFALFDGRFQGGAPAASSPLPCQWTITFDKVYQLQEIRFKLGGWNQKNFFRYTLGVSPDGVNFRPLALPTEGPGFGWQRVQIPSQPVKAIRLQGVFARQGLRFVVDEFEAYCIVPKP
ncbi:MAG: hypothetical protein JXB10_16000 [Pirellulales bacterium]|nr:hypothetical protein [Pirellulales bacterium]